MEKRMPCKLQDRSLSHKIPHKKARCSSMFTVPALERESQADPGGLLGSQVSFLLEFQDNDIFCLQKVKKVNVGSVLYTMTHTYDGELTYTLTHTFGTCN